jgi:hypothetical protein
MTTTPLTITPPETTMTPATATQAPAATEDTAWQDLMADLDVAAATGAQAQGDVLVLPWPAGTAPAARAAALVDGELLPTAGVVVLRGAGGHTHVLYAAGPGVAYAPTRTRAAMTLGVLTVPPGATAVLAHDEHTNAHIGPGVYALRRQRTAALTTAVRTAPQAVPATALAWD